MKAIVVALVALIPVAARGELLSCNWLATNGSGGSGYSRVLIDEDDRTVNGKPGKVTPDQAELDDGTAGIIVNRKTRRYQHFQYVGGKRQIDFEGYCLLTRS